MLSHALTTLILASAAATASPGVLVVDITAIDVQAGGSLAVYVYTDSDSWLTPEKKAYSRYVQVTDDEMTVALDNIPFGIYAVSVIQDLNANRKIDMIWFPFPRPGEPAGVSNNAEALLGAPSFQDARFQFQHSGQTISISLED